MSDILLFYSKKPFPAYTCWSLNNNSFIGIHTDRVTVKVSLQEISLEDK